MSRVAVVMGSSSDLDVMVGAVEVLEAFEVAHDVKVVSAHRAPHAMLTFARDARAAGYQVVIAGAGGAAHLPGMLAAATTLPVVGVPVGRPHLDGLDSLLSIVQMPSGIPVATVGIDDARNAGLLAVRMLSLCEPALAVALDRHAAALEARVDAMNDGLPERIRLLRVGG